MEKPKIEIRYYGEDPIMARIESGLEKVQFKKGDCHFADIDRAKHLTGAFKFEVVEEGDKPKKKAKNGKKKKVEEVVEELKEEVVEEEDKK